MALVKFAQVEDRITHMLGHLSMADVVKIHNLMVSKTGHYQKVTEADVSDFVKE